MKLKPTGTQILEYFTSEHGTWYSRDGNGYWQGNYFGTWVSSGRHEELEAAYQKLWDNKIEEINEAVEGMEKVGAEAKE